MKKNHLLLLLCLLLFRCFTATAQPENNNWCFGHKTGLTFSNGSPVFFEHNLQVYEGSASVSDAAGDLLFYTSGAKVWDRNGNLMPNGAALSGNEGSSTSGVAIIPSPSNANQYYIVTTDQIENSLYNAYYSVVDISLNGGLGDAIPAQSNIVLAGDIAEGVTIAHGDDCGQYWIMLHRRNNEDYLAFKVDAGGVTATPVISTGLPGFPQIAPYGNYGFVQFNRAGDRLMRLGGTMIETASFNKATGVLTGFAFINPAPYQGYYAAFSPNDNLLYFAGVQNLCQMNMALFPNITAVQSSIIKVDSGSYSGMRLGPDNKLYVMRYLEAYIGCVNFPDIVGMGCGPNPTALPLPPYAFLSQTNPIAVFTELGNPVLITKPDTVRGVTRDTMICFLSAATLHGDPDYNTYQWSNGSTGPTATVSQDGIYWLRGTKDCKLYTDTFQVHFNRFNVDIGPDTNICTGQTKLLDATVAGATYQWQDGSSAATYEVTQAGTYSIAISKEGCTGYDTIHIDVVEPKLNIIEPDTELCKGQPITLHAVAVPASRFLWSNGSTGDQIQTDGAGIYTVTATSQCGPLKDEVQITEVVCNCTPFVPNAFSPNGDGKNDVFRIRLLCPGLISFYFAIYNRYGQRVFQSVTPDTGWDGLQNGRQADAGTYFYYLKYKIGDTEYNKKGDVILIR